MSNEATTKKEDLICNDCKVKQVGGGQFNCEIHGCQYIAWKCYLCCKEAVFFCFGTHYLCEEHHNTYKTAKP